MSYIIDPAALDSVWMDIDGSLSRICVDHPSPVQSITVCPVNMGIGRIHRLKNNVTAVSDYCLITNTLLTDLLFWTVLILPGISVITTCLLGYISITSKSFTTKLPYIDSRIYLAASAATNIFLMCLTGRILVTTWMIWAIFIYNFQNMQLLTRTAKKEPNSCNSNVSQTQLRQMQLEICLVTTLSDNLNVSNSRVRRVGLELSRVGGPSGSTVSSGNIV
ncbi:hypothetical protein C8R45DRAFT_943036 [Mycena sanguinolenta]|nr:hypothetical protein C8R45DRAFT_943036 [Mycena sanguinolenta]